MSTVSAYFLSELVVGEKERWYPVRTHIQFGGIFDACRYSGKYDIDYAYHVYMCMDKVLYSGELSAGS